MRQSQKPKRLLLKKELGRVIAIVITVIAIFFYYQQLFPIIYNKPLSFILTLGILTLFIIVIGLIALCFRFLNKIKELHNYIDGHCDGQHFATIETNKKSIW